MIAVVGAVGILAAACGGDDSPQTTEGGIAVTVPEQVVEANPAVLASRPGEGISAAGGTLAAGEPCPAPGSPGAAETVKIALSTPDVFDLAVIGLGNLVYDDPGHVIDAYVNKVNSLGGINGHCFEFVDHVYGFVDPAGDIGRICTELPAEEPLVLLGLGLNDAILGCATLGAQIPTVGLYAQFPNATFAQAGGLLRVDHGAREFLLENGMEAAFEAGALTTADSVGLFYLEGDNVASERAVFDSTSARLGLQVAASAGVPPDFSGTGVLVLEQQFRQLGGEIFDPDMGAFDQSLATLPPDIAGLMRAIRQHFVATAAQLRDAGVTAVVASAGWDDVRNLMRAAELADWYPKWIINDSHYAFLVLTDAPKAQGLNLVQVSSRRAADDPIDGRDRGCLSLRNADTAADPFAHRFHTDAWSLMTSICDYLDVVFGAVSRVDGPLTRESFLAALAQTDYEAAHGQSVRFDSGDLYGSDSFRVLSADPDCVLNDWGCMRSLTDWLEPSAAAGQGSGTEG
ncbi:MAG: hypothetical protein F4004_08360 [Acidimicrobiia bacterium]|nr:hypothetical protein [Acidimicrobiia bacterium]